MSSHDEYSSDEEDFTAGTSDVLLGYVDISLEEETPSIEDTFIGGQPIWLHADSVPKHEDLQCANCHKDMALLLQAYCPLESGLYDRVIYIFACKDTRQCSMKKGSVRAIRGVKKDPKRMAEIKAEQEKELEKAYQEKMRLEEKRQYEIEVTKDLFSATNSTVNPFGSSSSGSNPFGSSSSGSNPFEALNPFEKKDEKDEKKDEKKNVTDSYASIAKENVKDEKKEKKEKEEKIELPSFPGYFVYTEEEKFKRITVENELEKYKHLIDNSEAPVKERSMSQSSGTLNPENNKIASMLNDKYFENFTSVVGHNPAQVLRYHLGGKPLLYSGKDDVSRAVLTETIPDPAYNPSSRRQFELQLMPKAIIDLENIDSKSTADILSGMAWGTIIVATDVEDYVPELDSNHVAYVSEYCGVQWEETV